MTQPQQDGGWPPVRVQLASVEDGVALGPGQARKRISGRAYTVVLTAANPVDTILDEDQRRLYALVQAGGNNVVISSNFAEADSPANQQAGLPNPLGMVVPFGNTQPVKIPGWQRWWAAAAAYPAQVTVLVVQED